MESMDYNYFSVAQPYQYMGYGDMMQRVSSDAIGATPSIGHLDTSAFSIPNFDDFTFPSSVDRSIRMTPIPDTSTSPPAQHLLILPNGSVDSGIAPGEDEQQEPIGRRSSSEEKDGVATPAQSRRKAQNRAAQRAFRERKERHVRDLEAKLNLLTTTTSSLQSDNERLKLMLQRAQTENEILRATASSPKTHHPPGFVDDSSLLPSARRSKSTSESHLQSTRSGRPSMDSSSPSRQDTSPESDGYLLPASATWDLLQSHPFYLSGVVDIGEVCERLKKMARSDGTGPMFDEKEVRKVIDEVGRIGSDELI